MTTIESEWETFAREVVPPDANPVQRQEMRRAFYAGVRSMFHIGTRELAALSDDHAEERLQKIERELKQFGDDGPRYRLSEYKHAEAFNLMHYECERCKKREVLWNSRDGVTPFCISCRDCTNAVAQHVDFNRDVRDPNFGRQLFLKAFRNMRVFIDASPDNKHIQESAAKYVEKYWNDAEYQMRNNFSDKPAAIAYLIKDWTKPGSPAIVTAEEFITGSWRKA
jgi:hypothetical protein